MSVRVIESMTHREGTCQACASSGPGRPNEPVLVIQGDMGNNCTTSFRLCPTHAEEAAQAIHRAARRLDLSSRGW